MTVSFASFCQAKSLAIIGSPAVSANGKVAVAATGLHSYPLLAEFLTPGPILQALEALISQLIPELIPVLTGCIPAALPAGQTSESYALSILNSLPNAMIARATLALALRKMIVATGERKILALVEPLKEQIAIQGGLATSDDVSLMLAE